MVVDELIVFLLILVTHFLGYHQNTTHNQYMDVSLNAGLSPPVTDILPDYTYFCTAHFPQAIIHEYGVLLCGGCNAAQNNPT